MAGYTRQDTADNIANGKIIDADDLDSEFDAVESAFNSTTGHNHDGTTGEGARITAVGPAGEMTVTSTAIQPASDNALDLGTSSIEMKDGFFDGTLKTDVLTVDETSTFTGAVTASAAVSVGTTLTVGGAATFNGNVTLGNAASDTVAITADVASHVLPSADNTYDLGASGSVWRNLYANNIIANTVDGRDVATDGTKLDGIESNADVTDTANVTAAGALMDSELTSEASVKALNQGVATTDSPTFAGLTSTSHVSLSDNDELRFGNSDDLIIEHNANDSDFRNSVGDMYIRNFANDKDVYIQSDNGSGGTTNYFVADGSTGQAKMYHYGSQKLSTSSTGVDVTGNISVSGTVDSRDVAADGTKLDGIEAGATSDQTASEIRALVESASDSNVFTDADHSKLNGIESNATADQTSSEIRTLVESASDSNVFTDADHSKLNGIEASADVTDTANVTAAGALMDSECASVSSLKAINQGLTTTSGVNFATVTTSSDVTVGGELKNSGGNTVLVPNNAPYLRNSNTGTSAGQLGLESLGVGYVYRATSTTTQFLYKFQSDVGGTQTTVARVDVDGDFRCLALTETSDARVKDNIVDANSQWSDIKDMRLCNYTMKDNGERHLGVIAQELQNVSPGLVKDISDEEDGSLLGVNKSGLMMKMLGALQEAMARIEELEARAG